MWIMYGEGVSVSLQLPLGVWSGSNVVGQIYLKSVVLCLTTSLGYD